MSATITLDDLLRSKIERIVTEEGFTSADELVRKLVDEHIAVRELRSAVAIGIASPKHPYDPAFFDELDAKLRRRAGLD